MKFKTQKSRLRLTTCFLCFSILILPFVASAYTLLQPLPGLDKQLLPQGGFASYLQWLFKFALAAAAFLAVTQIVIGGVQLIMSGASEKIRGDAQSRIYDAIWGLLLAFSAWLILDIINPGLVNMNLEIPDVKMPIIAVKEEPAGVNRDKISENDARAQFSEIGISVKNQCSSGKSVDCVQLEGIRQSTIDELKNLKEQFPGAKIYVTGGTESGHSSGTTSHSNGYKVDLMLNAELDSYIMKNFIESGKRSDGAKKWVNPKTGAVYALEMGAQPHWDVVR